ncbi:DUF58 domain-containing protein [Micromonospora sp. NPDC049559]|uniref:DUF58 domain-containing protein n=1 Tax=Micromonospora sp. NPDC049559 TaxID=3155923 RepID=UPI00342E09A9
MTGRRRTRPRLTRTGRRVLAAAALLVPAGAVADYPELVTIGLAGALALGYGLLRTVVPPQVRAERRFEPGRLPEGGSARCRVTVSNPGRRRSGPAEVVDPATATSLRVPAVPPGGRHEVEPYEVVFERRGVHRLPPPLVGRADPFGLWRQGVAHGQPSVVTVHPRVHPVLVPGVDRTAAPSRRATRAGAVSDDSSFHTLRPYEPGDDHRLIHWMSSARTGDLMVREERVPPSRPGCVVVLDTGAHRYGPELFDEAVRVAAAICVSAIRSGVPASLRGPAGTATSETAVLDLLTTVTTGPARRGLPAIVPPAPPAAPTALILVTGRIEADEPAALARTAPAWAAVHVVAVDADESAPAPAAAPVSVVRVGGSADFVRLWRRP